MTITINKLYNGFQQISLQGDIFRNDILDIKKKTDNLLKKNVKVLMDLRSITYYNTSLLNYLIEFYRKIKPLKGKLLLIQAESVSMELFQTFSLGRIFHVFRDLESFYCYSS